MQAINKSIRLAFCATSIALITLFVLAGSGARPVMGAPPNQGGVTPTPSPRRLPANEPERGLVYDGLEPTIVGSCRNAFKLRDSNRCAHGPDPAPSRLNIK